MEMPYRRMGRSGLQLSLLSFGSWVTFANQLDLDAGMECMQVAYEGGMNFFDNAESYAGGRSEELMGQALRQLGWPRDSFLVSTKFFWGLHDRPNSRNTLNRKYLMEAIDGSLERLGLDHVDLVYCHRHDPDTPVEETVWAMSDMISTGRAHYWGTSEWPAERIREAWEVAERHHLHKPKVEQPQYNLLHRERVEDEYASLYTDLGLGLTTWSPLSSGLLTGKYLEGVPEDASPARLRFIADRIEDKDLSARLRQFVEVAKSVGCTPAQLAIAWCADNPNVSSVITGASRPSQVEENLVALEVLDRLDDEVRERLDAIFS